MFLAFKTNLTSFSNSTTPREDASVRAGGGQSCNLWALEKLWDWICLLQWRTGVSFSRTLESFPLWSDILSWNSKPCILATSQSMNQGWLALCGYKITVKKSKLFYLGIMRINWSTFRKSTNRKKIQKFRVWKQVIHPQFGNDAFTVCILYPLHQFNFCIWSLQILYYSTHNLTDC